MPDVAFVALTLFLLGLLLAGIILVTRRLPKQAAAEPLTYWRLVLPRGTTFPVSQAAAWFASLTPLLSPAPPQPWVELRGEGQELVYALAIPGSWEVSVRGQLAAWFPEARLEPDDGSDLPPETTLPLTCKKPSLFPLHVADPGHPDPLLGVIGVLTQEGDRAGVRVTFGPPPRDWSAWAPAALSALHEKRRLPPRGFWFTLFSIVEWFRAGGGTSGTATASPGDPQRAGATRKIQEPVVSASLAVWVAGTTAEARQRAEAIASLLQTGYRDPFGNELVVLPEPKGRWGRASTPEAPELVLSMRELAALFHVPSVEHPLIASEVSRRVAPSVRIVTEGSERSSVTWLGEALLPEKTAPFGLTTEERRHHTYVVGKTGSGKSTLLASILKQDLEAGRGVGLIDPHGDLAERVLSFVPPKRYHQVLYFNPSDTDFPVGFNPFASQSVSDRPLVASALVGVFKKLYGESWGPRLEYFLRNAILALLETPVPSLLALPRILTDKPFREKVLEDVRDPLLRTFFTEEYESYDPRFRTEAISPILNKVGQFLSSPVVRHIVGQSTPGFNLRQVMDSGGIFIANLATGKLGEDNAALLGGLLVAAFQLAAMSRADQPEEERVDFFLAADEFQRFANEAFASILSEARKYRLSLTLAHQYLDQIPGELLDAVFGNVGSLCCFRVGALDTIRLVRELAPIFDAQDLVNLPNYQFCARVQRQGETIAPFSARTIFVPDPERNIQWLMEQSRQRWARPRAEVEVEVADLWEGRLS